MATPQEIAALLAPQQAPQTPAMGALAAVQAARDQLATQPQRLAVQQPTSYGNPEADQAAMQPETFANPAVRNVIDQLTAIPERAIRGSMADMATLGSGEPKQSIAPATDAALMMMGGAGVVPAEANSLRMGIKAYHGSPHNFDAFSMDKIGTGEGAQAYGHGLYFADQEAVAKQYRDQLRWKGADFNDPQTIAQNALDRHGDREAAANSLQSAVDSTKRFHGNKMPASQAEANGSIEQAITALRGNDPITGAPPTPGHMYEVNINADPEHFLDWDKPLSEQSDPLKDSIRKLGWDPESYTLPNGQLAPSLGGPRGQDAYRRIGYSAGPKEMNDTVGRQIAAAQALRDAGIPGIKYLDQGSRATGDGSRNYVLFDDKLVDIARKYGMGSIAALPPAALAAMTAPKDETQ